MCAAQTPRPGPIDIPRTERETGLSSSSIKQIDDWLKYYTGIIRTARDEKKEKLVKAEEKIVKARDGIIRDIYNWYDESLYKYEVARRAAVIVTPLLEGHNAGDSLRHLRQVNAAMAVSRMAQVSIQPALEKMVTSKNAAVRRLGWVGSRSVPARGYRAIRTRILVQSVAATNTMFASLEKAARTEKNAQVVAAVFHVLNLPQSPTVPVPEKTMRTARVRAFGILKAAWRARCRQVIAEDTDMSEACRKGVSAVLRLTESLGGNDKKARTAGLQMIVDAAWCAATAYDKAMTPTEEASRVITRQREIIRNIKQGDEEADSKIRAATAKIERAETRIAELRPKVVVNSLLLRDCEAALNRLAGVQKNHLVTMLTKEKIHGPRGPAVQLAVLVGWVKDLEKQGVVAPKFKAPAAPATTPTARPAAPGR